MKSIFSVLVNCMMLIRIYVRPVRAVRSVAISFISGCKSINALRIVGLGVWAERSALIWLSSCNRLPFANDTVSL